MNITALILSLSLSKLLRSRLLIRRTKLQIYKTVIQPVILYGAEIWILTKKSEMKLVVFENKILRRIFVSIQENGK